MTSISRTLDGLIQRISKVKVCVEHLKLVSTNLTRLQNGLNEIDNRRSNEDIAHTLKAIDEIITGCSENEAELNGMTYRDLECLLLRLQLRLAQHEADLTDDYEAKVQILSNAHHEQQILVQKIFDEKIRQSLDAIEQRTKEYTIEQIHLLRGKHFNTINVYLRCCTELHKSVALTGLTGDIVAKIAHTFYHISSEDQIQLENNWQSYDLPLTRTFIQFKPDKSTSFERNESRRLLVESGDNLSQGQHDRRESLKGIWQRLVSAPYMMSMVERDRYSEAEDVTEESIIRTKRWIVILGDPGSGKTSFTRWLVRHLAQTLLLNGQHSTEYGPLRIPILIRIGEFAEMLRDHSSLTLFDYIGKHKWMGKSIVDDPSISVNNLSWALQDYIKHGQAIIILDGLDEISISEQRPKIINIVENFVDTYVQTPAGASVFDDRHLTRLFDDPSKSGGNQLIVTSRIVGYHAAPLAGQFAHYTSRSMNKEHMKDFVDYWFFRVHQQILDTLNLSVPNQGENHGEALKKELDKIGNVGLLDVASNSCLISFICSVAFSQLDGSPLPTQRIRLYEQIVNSMLSLWSSKRSTIPIPELVHILTDIATYIHENSASGLIDEEKMKEVCMQSIKASININHHIEEIDSQASEFVRIIREDVGILAARGESLYGFLHLTFQEYFTCLKLINIDKLKQEKLAVNGFCQENQVQLVSQSLHQHTSDPRFRVPVALALGKISSSWSQKDFNDFCHEFIQEQDDSDPLLPFGAYTLITCVNDLVNYPSDDILFDTFDSLMTAAGQHKWAIVCPFLIDQITIALRKLRNDIVPLWINHFLLQSPPHDIQTIAALCHLIHGKSHQFENIKWLDQSSCSMLQDLSLLDSENNEFVIDRLLVKIAFSNHRLLPVNPTTFKGFLLGKEIELNLIPVILFPLIITLYGGLKRDGQVVVFDPFYIYRESPAVTLILVRFLSRRKQDENIMIIKQECLTSLLTRIENHDESCETVDLCIACICLYGIEYVRENVKMISPSLLRMSMNRLKYISMILRQFYFIADGNNTREITKFISNVIEEFEYGKSSKIQFLNLLNSLRTGIARLRSSETSTLLEGTSNSAGQVTLYLPNSFRREHEFLNYVLSTDKQLYSGQKSCSLLQYFTNPFWILEHNDKFDTQYRMATALDKIPEYLLFRCDRDVLFSLTFIPTHLRNLYLHLLEQGFIMIHPEDFKDSKKEYIFFGHILLECLMLLSNTSCKRFSLATALIALLPMLRMHNLENFGSSFLWTLATNSSEYLSMFETVRQFPMNYETGVYMNRLAYVPDANPMEEDERRKLIEKCIEQEYQRFRDALTENDKSSTKMYSACISLARICRWNYDKNSLYLLEESVQGAMSINNKLVRLDALCMIALYSHSDYAQIQVNKNRSLQEEIDSQLHDVYPDLPLLLHTAIFIRCLPLLQHQQTIDKCLQNLLNKFNDADQRDQQIVYEALSPYLQSTSTCSLINYRRAVNNKSSVLQEYFDSDANENLHSSLFISNLYLAELASETYKSVAVDDLYLLLSSFSLPSIETTLSQIRSSILTLEQTLIITNSLSSLQNQNLKTRCDALSNVLHRFNFVEFKACRLLEYWMKWKNSTELFFFAYHAALLLVNSDLWSVEAATIVCDLLCSENDRFRQRAEMILRSPNDDDIRTSSKLGIDVLLTLGQRRAHYYHISPFHSLTLTLTFWNMTLDNKFHLETLLWLERYRVHASANKIYSLNQSRSSTISNVASYFPTDITMNISFCGYIYQVSSDLITIMCDMIGSNLISFLEIDGDTTSNEVLESHTQFVISVVITVGNLLNYNDTTRPLAIEALTKLLEISNDDDIRRTAACAIGYVCDKKTCKILFKKIESNQTSNHSDDVLSALISSYCHCLSVNKIQFDQDDLHLFRLLLKHSSQNILKTVHVGLGRVLKNSSLLFEMLDFDYVQSYQALIGSTAYVFVYNVQRDNENAVAEFIEQHPDLLPIFVIELYNSIRHFTLNVLPIERTDNYFAYGYPQYVEVASLIAVRMPAAFCAYIKEWRDGNDLKRALFCTSKQHHFPQRAACLTVLSLFGELTVELCEMFIEALRDDPHVQNTCYQCLTRITSIKDEKTVLNLLFSCLQSKSMNVRYVATKILLHLSRSSLISSKLVRTELNNLILDPNSKEDLWLIEEQDKVLAESVYYYAGPLKDVIYSLLVQHLTGDATGISRRNELNDIDSDFIESEKAARLASCLYETKR